MKICRLKITFVCATFCVDHKDYSAVEHDQFFLPIKFQMLLHWFWKNHLAYEIKIVAPFCGLYNAPRRLVYPKDIILENKSTDYE